MWQKILSPNHTSLTSFSLKFKNLENRVPYPCPCVYHLFSIKVQFLPMKLAIFFRYPGITLGLIDSSIDPNLWQHI